MEQKKSVIDLLQENGAEMLASSNQSEAEVMKQIVVVDTGSLALLGVFVSVSKDLSIEFRMLMTISACLLFISLLAAIVHFVSAHLFFSRIFRALREWKVAAQYMEDGKAREYVNSRQQLMRKDSTSVPYWMALSCFIGAALTISILIIRNVWL